MIYISHRGNLFGPDTLENDPDYIRSTIDKGYNVEIDLWANELSEFWLGHDKPEHYITNDFLYAHQSKLWCHAKNLLALKFLLDMKMHCFWHQSDDYTLTSKGVIWVHPEKRFVKNSVVVCKTREDTQLVRDINNSYGICSDWVGMLCVSMSTGKFDLL